MNKDFWYAPGGEADALGSSGAPSAPWDFGVGRNDYGFGQPVEVAQRDLNRFVKEVARTYGKVADPTGTLIDPRGHNAVSSNPSDYYEGHEMDPMAPEHLTFEEDDLIRRTGEPELVPFQVGTPIQRGVLAEAGLSPSGVNQLAEGLSVQRPETLAGLAIPAAPARATYVTETGIGQLHPGLREPVQHMLNRKPVVPQMVDSNGVVFNKYAPGTGPYDAPGGGREGGIAGAQPGTVIRGDDGFVCQTYGAPAIGEMPYTSQYGGGGGTQAAPLSTNIQAMSNVQAATPSGAEPAANSPSGKTPGMTACQRKAVAFMQAYKSGDQATAMGVLDSALDMGCPWAAKARDMMEKAAAQKPGGFIPETAPSGAPEYGGAQEAAAEASGRGTPWAHIFGFVGVTAAVVAGGMLVYKGAA